MCEASECKVKTFPLFPLRKAPEDSGKFPFRDMKYYSNPEPEECEVKVATKTPRFGYVAQRSIEFFEATGRKPKLENVMWPTRKGR